MSGEFSLTVNVAHSEESGWFFTVYSGNKYLGSGPTCFNAGDAFTAFQEAQVFIQGVARGWTVAPHVPYRPNPELEKTGVDLPKKEGA